MYCSIPQTPNNKRVFGACLLSCAILISPIAGAAPRSRVGSSERQTSVPSNTTQPSTKELFVSPPAPPVVPGITAAMADSLINDDGDGKIDSTNGLLGTEKIQYTVTLSNAGTDAIGVSFTDLIDP